MLHLPVGALSMEGGGDNFQEDRSAKTEANEDFGNDEPTMLKTCVLKAQGGKTMRIIKMGDSLGVVECTQQLKNDREADNLK